MIPIAARNAAVYPRWRGEHDKSLTKNNSTPGLSPLARGTHHYFGKSVIKNRFIPAGAGNTYRSNGRNTEFSVYPRWRGEHEAISKTPAIAAGLSPLARGTPGVERQMTEKERFIPAGAGNTSFHFTWPFCLPVYPRWRGEHRTAVGAGYLQDGLSPLARGTLATVGCMTWYIRFIPAGAGNTPALEVKISVAAVYPRWRGEHSKHNLLLINDFLSQSQSTNFIVSHKQHIHYVKEYLIH